MTPSRSINSSKNALVINLKYVDLEEIVEKKLTWFLNRKTRNFKQKSNILNRFYHPVERAVIEFGLNRLGGNQLKTAIMLGLNRNTLIKKIKYCKINVKKFLRPKNENFYPENRIFLSTLSSLNLTSACRAKLAVFYAKNPFPKKKALESICRPVDQMIVEKIFEYCEGNKLKTALALGVSRTTLDKKLCRGKRKKDILPYLRPWFSSRRR